ncbi:HTH_Tnp_Tc3_2 domain-containing protein [Trichonephila clavipes]|nr:HTH_Tnp_Tc3_2 domain-containing protein [Trichonephila clavipes]
MTPELIPAPPNYFISPTGGHLGPDIFNVHQFPQQGGFLAKLLGAVDTRRYPRVENRVWSYQEDHEERESKDQALVSPTVTRSTIQAEVGVAIVPQTISRHLAEANHKSKRPFRALPISLEHQQLRLQWCQARSMWNVTDWQKVVFSDESRFFWGHMITVYGCGGALLSGTIPPTLFYGTLSAQLV